MNRKANPFFTILLVCLTFSIQCKAELPEQYTKKNYVELKSSELGNKYLFEYQFKDEKNLLQKWQWAVPIDNNDYVTSRFGIPLDRIRGDQIKIVSHDMRYFVEDQGVLRPDYSGLLNLYRPISKPLFNLYSLHVQKNNLKGRAKIEFLLRFLQDYPYGLVPENFDNRFVNGLLPVSEIFKTGWADCDSKSLLMATILSYDSDFKNKMAMIGVPGHALLGIQGIPRPYEKYVTYRGKKYIYAEPVGVVRTPFGRTNSPYTRSIQVYPLETYDYGETESSPNIELVEDIKTDNVNSPTVSGLTESDCPSGAFLLKYDLPDGTKKQQCAVSKSGEIINHGPSIIFDASGNIVDRAVFEMGIKYSSP